MLCYEFLARLFFISQMASPPRMLARSHPGRGGQIVLEAQVVQWVFAFLAHVRLRRGADSDPRRTPAYSQLLAARCRYWVMQALTSPKISPTLFGERALCRLRPAASAHRRQAARARLRAAALLGPPHETTVSTQRCLSAPRKENGALRRGGLVLSLGTPGHTIPRTPVIVIAGS